MSPSASALAIAMSWASRAARRARFRTMRGSARSIGEQWYAGDTISRRDRAGLCDGDAVPACRDVRAHRGRRQRRRTRTVIVSGISVPDTDNHADGRLQAGRARSRARAACSRVTSEPGGTAYSYLKGGIGRSQQRTARALHRTRTWPASPARRRCASSTRPNATRAARRSRTTSCRGSCATTRCSSPTRRPTSRAMPCAIVLEHGVSGSGACLADRARPAGPCAEIRHRREASPSFRSRVTLPPPTARRSRHDHSQGHAALQADPAALVPAADDHRARDVRHADPVLGGLERARSRDRAR